MEGLKVNPNKSLFDFDLLNNFESNNQDFLLLGHYLKHLVHF